MSSVTRALCCKNWASAKESLLSVQGVVRCIGLRQQKPGERFKLAGEREYRSPCELQPSGALLWDQQLCIELQGIDSNDSVMIYTDCGLGGLQWPLGMVRTKAHFVLLFFRIVTVSSCSRYLGVP